MARPRIVVDEVLLEKLTKLHLSTKAISDILNISEDTLNRRFAAKMDHWRSKAKSKIAEVLFDEGINKREPWALKALAQKHLDYSDRVEQKIESVQETTFKIGWADELDQLGAPEKDVTSTENPELEEKVQASSMGTSIGEDDQRDLDHAKETSGGSE